MRAKMQAKMQVPVDIRQQLKMIQDQDSKHVYALNTTEMARPSKGAVSMRATNQFGEQITVFISNTYIPVDLAEDIPKGELLQSSDFLRMLRQGMITLISDEEAEEALNSPEAKQESQRLYNEKYGGPVETPTNRRFAADGQQPIPERDPTLPSLRSGKGVVHENENEIDPYENISPIIRETMERNDLNNAERYNLVMNNSHSLTDEDLNYIMNATTNTELRQLISDIYFNRGRSNQPQ